MNGIFQFEPGLGDADKFAKSRDNRDLGSFYRKKASENRAKNEEQQNKNKSRADNVHFYLLIVLPDRPPLDRKTRNTGREAAPPKRP